MQFEIFKSAYSYWVRILKSGGDSLIRAAYDELRRVSASPGGPDIRKYSWCRQLKSALEELNLQHLWLANSSNLILSSKSVFLNSLESHLKRNDSNLILHSSFIPHYNTIKPLKRAAPYLNFKLPLHSVRRIAQLRLNLSTIFYEGRYLDMGMWVERNCKFCGDQLSLSHALHECKGSAALRRNFSLPECSEPATYLLFLSELSNKKQTVITYSNICGYVKQVIQQFS